MVAKNKTLPQRTGFCPVRAYTYDEDKEINGIWFDLPEGSRVKVARFGNPKFIEVYQRIVNELAPDIQKLTEEQQKELDIEATRKTFAEVGLLDWENLVNLDGSELVYSKEAAAELLEIRDFYSLISAFSQMSSLFLKYKIEDTVKN